MRSFRVVLIGLSPWIPVNSIFLQLPFYISTLGVSIASQLTLAVQISNIVPLIYHFITPTLLSPLYLHRLSCFIILACLLISSCLLLLSLNVLSTIHCALLILAGLSGAMGTLSNLVLWPLAASGDHILEYSLGIGLSPVIPGVLALIQYLNTDTQARIPVYVFYACIIGITLVSLVAIVRYSPGTRLHVLEDNQPLIVPQEPIASITRESLLIQAFISAQYFSLFGFSSVLTASYTTLTLFTVLGLITGSLSRLLCFYYYTADQSYIRVEVLVQTLAYAMCLIFSDLVYPIPVVLILSYSTVSFLFGLCSTQLYLYTSKTYTTRHMGAYEQLGSSTGSLLAYLVVLYMF